MNSAAERLRVEAKRRAMGEWKGKLPKIGAWLQAAQWIEDNVDEPLPEGTWPDLVTLANALRYDNTEGRGHGQQPSWDECNEQIKKIWLDRAQQVDDYIRREIERREIERGYS